MRRRASGVVQKQILCLEQNRTCTLRVNRFEEEEEEEVRIRFENESDENGPEIMCVDGQNLRMYEWEGFPEQF